MQDFEIHGHAMQLGWGQENRKEKFSNASGDSRVIVKDQKHLSDKVGVNLLKLRVKKLEFKLFFIHKCFCPLAQILQDYNKLGLGDKGN